MYSLKNGTVLCTRIQRYVRHFLSPRRVAVWLSSRELTTWCTVCFYLDDRGRPFPRRASFSQNGRFENQQSKYHTSNKRKVTLYGEAENEFMEDV